MALEPRGEPTISLAGPRTLTQLKCRRLLVGPNDFCIYIDFVHYTKVAVNRGYDPVIIIIAYAWCFPPTLTKQARLLMELRTDSGRKFVRSEHLRTKASYWTSIRTAVSRPAAAQSVKRLLRGSGLPKYQHRMHSMSPFVTRD